MWSFLLACTIDSKTENERKIHLLQDENKVKYLLFTTYQLKNGTEKWYIQKCVSKCIVQLKKHPRETIPKKRASS